MSKIEDYGYDDFKTLTEGWSEYSLEDGTVIRTRVILSKVISKVKGGIDFRLSEQSYAASFSPQKLKGPVGSSKILPEEIAKIAESLKKEDMDIIISKEYWNEYELSTGDKVYSKAVLVSASLTDRYDDIGDPIYVVQTQILHKVIPKKSNKEEK